MKGKRLTVTPMANLVGVAPGTLRALDRRGVFPARRDWNGTRIYTETDVARLRALAGLDPVAAGGPEAA
jgi:DNA-binding transcriptional MerR regulator